MIATAIKLKTMSCVVYDCKIMNKLTVSTPMVKLDCRKPIKHAFL